MKLNKTPAFLSLAYAIHSSLETRKTMNYMWKDNPIGYMEQCCTIRFDLGRRSGHTTNSLLLLQTFFKDTLFILHNHALAEYTKNLAIDIADNGYIHQLSIDAFSPYKVINAPNYDFITENSNRLKQRLTGIHYDCICIDGITDCDIDLIELHQRCFWFLDRNPNFTFLFLQ